MIRHLYAERSVTDHPWVDRFRLRLGLPVITVDGPEEVYRRVQEAEDPIAEGKRVLYLTRNRGAFVRPCPGTRDYACCDYWILHVGTYCTMDCAYCVLQGYFHPPVLQLFLNREDMFAELDRSVGAKTFRRIGTGEFTDSLLWETWGALSGDLVEHFGRQDHAVLELKTKTARIGHLQGLDHQGRTVVAWSVNTPEVIDRNERGTAGLGARIRAAETCQRWGYPVAFHFDPMVLYDGAEGDYERVVDRIFESIDPIRTVWISLGTFRFPHLLKPIVARRFPDSRILYGEFVQGMDGKQRYFKPLRIRLYRSVVERIRSHAPDLLVYFCMEDGAVWRNVLGFSPDETGGVGRLLDESAVRVCGLKKT
jgi:spore photoproduct lyase